MPYPIQTGYDDKIAKLKKKIHNKPGPNKGLQRRLTHARTNQYTAQQRNTPPDQLPWNAQAETTIGGLNRDFNDTQAQLGAQRATTEQDYGIAPGYNDATMNPYSRAALLQQTYERNKATTMNTYAGRGQLYAGSTQNAANYDLGQQGAGLDQLQKSYLGDMTSLAQQGVAAQRTLTEGTAAARAKALEDALNAPLDPTEAPALPGFVKKDYRQRIRNQRQAGHKGKARKLRQKLAGLTNPNPMP